jgi:predicted lipoprotein with Yx(FWY)xxD motif
MHNSFVRAVSIGAIAFATLGLAACGSSSKSSTGSSATTQAPGTSPVTSASAGGYGATPTTMGAAGTAGTTSVKLASVTNKDVGTQKVLVTGDGKTLYVWDNDKTAGKASCTGACAQAWPPDYVMGTASYGTGLNATMFSTVTGPNGQMQLAVNGKPLYLWAADKKAGDATGQGVNGFYVVAANGNKIDAS